MTPELNERSLIERAQAGSREAYGELVTRHGALAYRVGLRMLGNHHDAEDVAQEALMVAWQDLSNFRVESNFSTWLYQIVTRRALNRLTRTKVTSSMERVELADDAVGPAGTAERNQAIDAVTRAVSALPASQRAAVVLHHLEGFSYADVARLTDSSTPAVRSHLHRARRALSATLQSWS